MFTNEVKRKECVVSGRIFEDELKNLEKIVAQRGSGKIGSVVREAVTQFLEKEHTKDELKGMEERISASFYRLQRDMDRVREDTQLLIALLDQLIQFQLIATPEIMDKESAVILGNRRYSGFLEELRDSMDLKSKRARLSKNLEQEAGDNDLPE